MDNASPCIFIIVARGKAAHADDATPGDPCCFYILQSIREIDRVKLICH
jgi:hypothetical protein